MTSMEQPQMKKKRSEETQTLCAGSRKTEPKNFAPFQTSFPGARDGQNLISWRWSLPLPTNPVWWGSIHAISTYHGNGPTNTHTNTHTNPQTGPITIHCAAASVQCNQPNRNLLNALVIRRTVRHDLSIFAIHRIMQSNIRPTEIIFGDLRAWWVWLVLQLRLQLGVNSRFRIR